MDTKTEKRLVRKFIKQFGCDTARISTPLGKMFLIVGWHQSTKDNKRSFWTKNGEHFDFDYIEEKVIAIGGTIKKLTKSAENYKRLQNMS
jgi:hypothetical protein